MNITTSVILVLIFTLVLAAACAPRLIPQQRNSRSMTSNQFHDGQFQNLVSTQVSTPNGNMLDTTIDFFRGNANRSPSAPLPSIDLDFSTNRQKDGVRVSWLGHSTCLIEIEGQVILTDPMFSDRASPFRFLGPRRFATEKNYGVEELPQIDAVLISHDHYDHLDYQTIKAIKDKVDRFYVPLGVGSRLQRWGLPASKITELDWWESYSDTHLTLVATPARHFSGRGLTDRNKSLWASWVIMGNNHRLFFSGDSGYFEGFKKIGDIYGPFDLTMLESGAYNEAWADIHMMPEETVQAHLDLRGKVLLPIHWAKFNLALHPWKEPIERLSREAVTQSVSVVTPQIGETFSPDGNYPRSRWWDQEVI